MVKCFLNPVASLFCVVLVIAPSLFRLFEIYIVSVTSLNPYVRTFEWFDG